MESKQVIKQIFFTLVFSLLLPLTASAEQFRDYYAEPGINPFKETLNQSFNETIDPFGGTLQLSYVDMLIPGNGGLDIQVNRTYTSLQGSLGARTLNGVGWTMHFGRIVVSSGNKDKICTQATLWSISTTNNPSFEHPDGSRELLVLSTEGNYLVTKSRWKAQCDTAGVITVTSPDGTTYLMDVYATEGGDTIYYVSKITDLNGNTININYINNGNGYVYIDTVTASDGRLLQYNYIDDAAEGATTQLRLSNITANGQTWQYNYTIIPGAAGAFYQLSEVVRPDSLKWQYEYNPFFGTAGVAGDYSVKRVTYPYGGVIDYTYKPVFFNTDPSALDPATHVVGTKTTSGPSITAGSWNFEYTPSTNGDWDLTTTTTPNSVIKYYHYGYSSAGVGSMWSVGLLRYKDTYDVTGTIHIQRDTNEWIPQTISNENYWHGRNPLRIDTETAVPLLAKKTVWRGDQEYIIEYKNYDSYGNPAQTVESTNTGNFTETGTFIDEPGRISNYTYDIDVSKWIINRTKDETLTSIGTITRTFDPANGNLLSSNRYGVTTSYTYTPEGDVETITDARSNITRYFNYHRGTAQRVEKPEWIVIERLVNDTGTLAWEKDGKLNTTSYTYDDLNRLTGIDYPISADVTVSWGLNSKTLNRGNYEEVVNYEGFGRQINTTRSDTLLNEAITTTQQYDALGQKVFQSYPNSTDGTQFSYDSLGRVTRVEHPDATFTTTSYGLLADQSANVTMTDERGNVTTKLYKSFSDPDEQWLLRTNSPENVLTSIGKNYLGQTVSIWQGEAGGAGHLRTYAYDARYYLESEVNPETGTTLYGRDELGNMTSKQVGASPVTYYNYDGLNRLSSIDYPAATPDVSYSYDYNGNVKTIYNANGQRAYTYDANNNLKTEIIYMYSGGITSTIEYDYDNLDVLDVLTYPSGKKISYKPNALGRPTQVSPYITSVKYYPSGETKQITYVNGQVTEYSLTDRLWLKDIKTNGVSNVVDQSYSYDASGNVSAISDLLDPTFDRSFEYDGLNRLTIANGVWGEGAITYDFLGNIKTKSIGEYNRGLVYSNNKLSLIVGDVLGTTPLEYDVYGNVKRKGYIYQNIYYDHTYDDASNLINSTKNRSVYNISSDPISAIDYKYDGVNNRIIRNSSVGDDIHYVFNKASNLLQEYDPNNKLKNIEYVYLRSQLITKIENTEPESNAGSDQEVYSGKIVTLDGSNSTAYNSQIVSYNWVQTSGDVVTINNSSNAVANFIAPNVTSDTDLSFDLIITDEAGLTHTDSVKVVVWLAAPSTAPINIVAVQGDGQNTISWTPSSQADSYNIYWGTSPDVTPQTGTAVFNVTSPYTHTGLTNGANYYYVVTSVNAYGESVVQEVRVTTGSNGWTETYNIANSNKEFDGIRPWAVSPSGDRAFIGYIGRYGGLAVKHFDRINGWSNEELVITSSDYNGASNLDYSINNNGDIAIILEFSETIDAKDVRSIKAIRYDASIKTWTPLETIRSWPDDWTLKENFREVEKTDIDDAGNVFVIIEQSSHYLRGISNSTTISYYILRYDSTLNIWEYVPGFIDSTTGLSEKGTKTIRTVMNSAGQYFAILSGYYYNKPSFANGFRYDPATGWAPTGEMPIYTGIRKMHMAENGDVLIISNSNDDPSYFAIWNRTAIGWESPAIFGDDATFFNSLYNKNNIAFEIDIDDSGNVIVARQILLNANTYTIRANRYTPTDGWGGTYVLDTFNLIGNSQDLSVNLEPSGNASVTWVVDDTVEYGHRTSQYVWFGSTYADQSLPPVALAGLDTSGKEGAIITLSGSGFDSEGGSVSYQWSQISGPTATFIDAAASTARFRLPTVVNTSSIGFKLSVTNSDGAVGTDVVGVTVYNLDYPVVQSVTPGNKQNTITWTSDPDAMTANLYWSTSPSVLENTNNLVSNITSPYVHTGLQNGVKIYYTFKSVDGNGNENDQSKPREFFSTPLENRILWSETDIGDVGYKPLVTMSGNGDANIIYNNINGVQKSRLSKVSGWDLPEQACGLSDINNKYFASDLNGSGFLAWIENASIGYDQSAYGDSIWVCQYDINTGWGSPFQLTVDNSVVYGELKITANSRGDFVLVWRSGYNSSNGREVYVKRYIAGSGWQANEKISTTIDKDISHPDVSINETGDIAVVWSSSTDTSPYLYETVSKQFSIDTGLWTEAASIQQTQDYSKLHAISIDDYKNVIVTWFEDEGSLNWNVFANRYDSRTRQWSGVVLLNNAVMHSVWDYNELEITSDGFGNAAVVWAQHADTPDGAGSYIQRYDININEYKVGAGWSGPVAISDSRGIDSLPKIAMNKKGDLIAVWVASKYTVTYSNLETFGGKIFLANYRPAGADWVGERVISLYAGNRKENFDVAIDPSGNAILAMDGILSRYVDRSTLQSPLNLVPTANAGSDQQILINNQVSLNGNLSVDPDGTIANYAWYQVDGPAVTLSDTSIVNPTFTAPVVSVNTPLTFLLTVTDDYGHTNSDLVVVNVLTGLTTNNPPVANDDFVTVLVDISTAIDAVSNDTDIDSDNLSITAVTQGSNGSVVINANNTINYKPATSFIGNDSFTYTIIDGDGGTSTGTVNVEVVEVLPNVIPVALNDLATTSEGNAIIINVLSNDTDADGDTLTVTNITQGSNGGVAVNADNTISYTPNTNFNGGDSFTYTINDGKGGSATSSVSVTITAINDLPVANDDTVTIVEDTVASAVNVLANDSDIDGDTLTITVITQGTKGSVVINADNTLSYTPNTNFNGGDSFSYTISDGNDGVATANVGVTVTAVNDIPVANDDVFTTTKNIAATMPVLSNDTDVDGDTLSVTGVSQSTNGAVVINANNTITYTPNSNFTGSDSFNYTISDNNGGVANANVSIQVVPPVTNLLINPGFETGDKTSWSGKGSVASGNAHSGNYALTAVGNPTGYVNTTQSVAVVAGNTYRFDAWLKVVGITTGNYRVQLRWYTASGSQIKTAQYNFGITSSNIAYTLKSVERVAPVDAASVTLQLRANKANGTGYFDDIAITDLSSTPSIDTQAPTVPMSVTATAASTTQIDLSWAASTDLGGGNVAGYKLYRDGATTPIATVTGNSYADTNLMANTLYGYTVLAFDNASPANESLPSNAVNATTLAVDDTLAPTIPGGVIATAINATQIDISWDASTDLGGGSVAGYKVFQDGTEIATVTDTSYSATGLTPDTFYSYMVVAFDNANPANESLPSASASATTLTTPTVTNLLLNPGFESGDLSSWSNGGTVETGNAHNGSYALRVTGKPTGYVNVTQSVPVVGGNTYRFESWLKVTGLTTGNFRFQIRWYDAANAEIKANRTNFGTVSSNALYKLLSTERVAPAGAVSLRLYLKANKTNGVGYFDDLSITDLSAVPAIDTQAPTVPVSVTATAVSMTQIDLSWAASTDVGGGSIAGYNIFRDGSAIPIATVTANNYADTGLTANSAYSYTVSAFDNASPANESLPSVTASTTTLAVADTLAPTVPIGLTATAVGSSQIDLSWIASTDIGGGNVAGYNIFRDLSASPIATVTGSNYADTGLTPDTLYNYTVSAFDNASPANESVPSSAASATTQIAPIITNLLSNGGFETGDASGWNNKSVVVATNQHSGNYALRMTGKATGYVNTDQSVPVTSGTTYRFESWLQVTGLTTGNFRIQLRWYDATGTEIKNARHNFGTVSSNSAYKQLSAERAAPAGAVSVRLYLKANKADGTGYFDDVSIQPL